MLPNKSISLLQTTVSFPFENLLSPWPANTSGLITVALVFLRRFALAVPATPTTMDNDDYNNGADDNANGADDVANGGPGDF